MLRQLCSCRKIIRQRWALRFCLDFLDKRKFLVLAWIRILERLANYPKALYRRYFVDITLGSWLSSWPTSRTHINYVNEDEINFINSHTWQT
jgi:hypothetical protein